MNQEDFKKMAELFLKKLRFLLKRYPFHNIILLLMLAPLGYLFPLLFPLLAYYSGLSIYTSILHAPTLGWPAVLDWWPVLLWILTLLLSLWLSYRISRIRPREPTGLALSATVTPRLFALLDELKGPGQMPIHRVIVTDQFQLDIVKTRLYILPVWSRNTLIIGLPLMQMLPPQIFKAMLARKLSQHSLFRNPLLHYLHQLNSAWRQYHDYLASRQAADMKLLKVFYGVYSPLYTRLVEPVARLDGLSADSYTLNVINDEDMVASIEYLFIAGMFIEKMFWPKLRNVARKQRNYRLTPFATLAKVGPATLAKLDINAWLEKEMVTGSSPRWGVAAMSVRLDGLGHNELYELVLQKKSAAELYIDKILGKVISRMDIFCQKNTLSVWQKEDDRLRREHALMATLLSRFKRRDYSFKELRQFMRLALRLGMKPALKLIFKMFFLTRIRFFRRKSAVAV